jgi:hypothetical protein
MATRDGMPAARSRMPIADAYCSQNPVWLRSRKSSSALSSLPAAVWVSYWKPLDGSK